MQTATKQTARGSQAFPLSGMSRDIRILTMICLAIPVGMAMGAFLGVRALILPAILCVPIYGWVWLLFRPSMFVIHPDVIEIIWPLKRRTIARGSIVAARLLSAKELKRELGWCLRVGAGGLWGGFGWLWTQRRGIVQMYLSRTDNLVWLERGSERPWLISPDRPEEFIRALTV
ncbi:MAG TPA: hypothetical protein DDY20_00215 [Desulfobulbaceae bacterium]|nr:hypothetical protein [Desulfobulbaceae bacterium]